ncbi:NAD(P)H-binding protein [Mycobacterium yunnanensis]|uniref:NAD(P)H-binding protein n=1 Tax=Mycobacterium yunnanensis TaxID=368477 RepID=A0A9X3BRN3_9MYCO|nr:NAD(P)H-binding protein [Mycobacterium yunnanensis]MCV7419719.1 NAD(P)H-binding protein [Mycobacterium yunnanensis]
MRALVTGATGYIGSRLVAALLAEGHEVVVGSRNPERLGDFGWIDDVTPVLLDAGDPETVHSAFGVGGPVDVVYYLVHGIGQPGYREADNAAAANVAEAAKAAGVKRIVYLGGFVPDADQLSEHLRGRAEVAEALTLDGGPEVVWLGAAIIIGAGSTSFEMLRAVGDRFLLIPMPPWANNALDPISISDVIYYLIAAADSERVPPGSYDIKGPETTTYGDLLLTYARVSGLRRSGVPVPDVNMDLVSQVAALFVPVPRALAADLVQSLDYPMTATNDGLAGLVPDPPGGPVGIEDAIKLSLSGHRRLPVDQLADPHHLADTDPEWAGGDVTRIRTLASAVTPAVTHPALGLLCAVPGPVAGWVRTGLDTVIGLAPKGLS